MLVFEYQCRVSFRNPLNYEKAAEVISGYIDRALGRQENYLDFHKSREFKYYCFDLPYPFESSRVYEAGKVYTVRIRTVKQDLAEYFSQMLPYHRAGEVCGMGGDLKIITKKMLECVYSLTPILMKDPDHGYWRTHMSLDQYEEWLKVNLIKKYNHFTGKKLDENFQLYELIEFKNRKPVRCDYKGITLLGDKISFITSKNETAQELWYFALGAGLGENCSRGNGFMNYRYL